MGATRATIGVVIADDHPVVRSGLRALFESWPDYTVLGEASDGEAACRVVVETAPDVVLLDVKMPGLDGIAAARTIRTTAPAVGILMLTMTDDAATVRAAIGAGANGYVLKGAEQEEIDRAVRAVAAGQAIFGSAVAGAALGLAADPPVRRPFKDLTAREREVLALMADGLRNGEIGVRLHLSAKTVANHVSSILAKLGVADRVAAVVLARREGLGGP